MTGDNSNSLQTSRPGRKLSESQRKEIVVILTGTATVLGETISAQRIDLFIQMVADLPFDPLRDCLKSWALTHKWFPKPAEVREQLSGSEKERAEAEALEAWEFLLGLVSEYWDADHGFHIVMRGGKPREAPEIDGKTWWAVRVCGGIDHIGWMAGYEPEKALDFLKRDFIQAYQRAPRVQELRKARLELGRQDQRSLTGGFTDLKGALQQAGSDIFGETTDENAPSSRQDGSGEAGS